MRTRRRSIPLALAACLVAGAVLVQCTGAPGPDRAQPSPAAPSATAGPPAPTPAVVHPVTAADLGATWHPGCPIEPGRLRRIEVSHRGFDGRAHRGELVVHQDLVAEVITIFDRLFKLGYPIEKIRTPDHYPGAADELSMEDNNSSAFSCRAIPGSDRWSLHAYGRAIDLNPLLNPSVSTSDGLEPTTAAPFLDRARTDPGLLHRGDPAVGVFVDRGWTWGGSWWSPIDYQHFERP